jgi:aquaporin Z
MTHGGALQALRRNWPEYLIEAWALGLFMLSAGLVTVLLEAPQSAARALLPDPDLRRALAGLAMGVTAVLLIYSRWGKRSGAHMNPAVTATFLVLGRMQAWDALFYIVAQFAGAVLGVACVALIVGSAFSSPEINYVATLPGRAGPGVAFLAETGISALLIFVVLTASGRPRLAPDTGLFAGALVALFITFEAPLSGMSMNPARSFASAIAAHQWGALWIYFTAPLLGMGIGAALHHARPVRGALPCAKLMHTAQVRCIHCGHDPAGAGQASSTDAGAATEYTT